MMVTLSVYIAGIVSAVAVTPSVAVLVWVRWKVRQPQIERLSGGWCTEGTATRENLWF